MKSQRTRPALIPPESRRLLITAFAALAVAAAVAALATRRRCRPTARHQGRHRR